MCSRNICTPFVPFKDELMNCYFAYLTSVFVSIIGTLLRLLYILRGVSHTKDVARPVQSVDNVHVNPISN